MSATTGTPRSASSSTAQALVKPLTTKLDGCTLRMPAVSSVTAAA